VKKEKKQEGVKLKRGKKRGRRVKSYQKKTELRGIKRQAPQSMAQRKRKKEKNSESEVWAIGTSLKREGSFELKEALCKETQYYETLGTNKGGLKRCY